MIVVEVVYAAGIQTTQQALVRVELPVESTVEVAIHASGLLAQFPEITLSTVAVGIFSQRVQLTDRLHHGDRVEIYRPLQIDPKKARRLRARG